MSDKKNELSIDEMCELLLNGETYRNIAKKANISLSRLAEILAKPEHSARVKEARRIAAQSYVDKAEEVIKDAKDALGFQKARELAHHYRWKAAKTAPKEYGEKVSMEHSGVDGNPIESNMNLSGLSLEELSILEKVIQKREQPPKKEE